MEIPTSSRPFAVLPLAARRFAVPRCSYGTLRYSGVVAIE
jgi:hypothetical protein